MSVRSVVVRLEAEVSQFVAGMGRAARETDTLAGNIVRTRRNVADNSAAMEKAGGTMLKAGAVTVGAVGAMAKAAIDWETAWTGVLKTVDGTPQQLDAVETGLRGLAKTLPSTHTEIAAVAEAAGQLGIETGSVVAFTKTMIDLGQSTNLSAEEAATGLARFSNVMGTSQDDVGKLGAALVGLGNSFATTESEILAMAMRLSGVGAQIGLSEGQVMGLSAAMSSVGIEAEAGGTAMSMVMKKISGAVDEGGEDVAGFAAVAGMSADEFSKAWKEDAGGALVSFVEGLGSAHEAGESVNTMLGDLGIKGIRETDSLLRLSAAGELVGKAMTQGVTEYTKGTALLEEANKRYQTSASKVAIAWNNIKDAAIDAGAVLLPIISTVMESVSGLASSFGSLPAPVQGTVTILALAAGGALLLGGGLLTLIPKIAATRVAFATLRTGGGQMVGTMGKIAKGAGIAGAALIAFQLASKVASREVVVSSEEMTAAIIGVTDSAKGIGSLDSVFQNFGSYFGKDLAGDINGVGDAVKRVVNPEFGDGFQRGIDGLLGFTGLAKSETTTLDNRFKELGTTLGEMATNGNTEAASKAFRELATTFEESGSNAADALAHMPGYENALLGIANQAGTATDKNTLLKMALGDIPDPMAAAAATADVLTESLDATGVSVDAVVEDMQKFLELLFQTGMLTMSARDANAAYNEALAGVDATLKTVNESAGAMGNMLNENKTDFDMTTEAGRAANATFQDVARAGMAEVEAKAKAGAGMPELQDALTKVGQDLGTTSGKLGITGDAADALTRDILGIPDGVSIESWMSTAAQAAANDTKKAIDDIPKVVNVSITTTRTSIYDQKGAPGRADMASDGSWISPLRRAAGGPVAGPGTGTSDDVPIWGSNGEHMLTTAEVQQMGGHDAVYRFRAAVRNGDAPGFSNGGAIGGAPGIPSSRMAASRHLASMSASAGGVDSAALDRLTAAVKSARSITVQALSTSRATSMATAKAMEGL